MSREFLPMVVLRMSFEGVTCYITCSRSTAVAPMEANREAEDADVKTA